MNAQALAALDVANHIRCSRARLKREVKAGEAMVWEALIDEIPDWLKGMSIGDLIISIRYFKTATLRRLLADCPCSYEQQIGWLTQRQREWLASALLTWESNRGTR